MQPVELFPSSSRDPDNRWASSARLLNCYREPSTDGRVTVKSVLGTEAFANTGAVFCRAMEDIDGMLYVVAGGEFFRISSAGASVKLGDVADSEDTTISGNNGDVTVCAGGRYYLWNGTTLTEPTAGAFSAFGSVTFFGQLTVLTERNGRRVQWSNVADASTLGGLDFATTESRDDDNLRAQPIGGELWIFKTRSIERWYQDGADVAAIAGGTIDIGLKGFRLLTRIGAGGVFFVGDDNRAYLAPEMQPLSIAPVETSIATEGPTECFYYEDEGHKFCVINFRDRPAWVCDLSTGEWHERGEGSPIGAWQVQASARSYGNSWYLGGYAGAVLKLVRSNEDNGEVLVRRAIGRTLQNTGARFRVASMQIQGKMGNAATEPKITLRCSDDFGFSYGDEIEKGLGAIGQQDARVVFRSLGSYYQFTPELTWTDNYDFILDSTAFVRFA